MAPPRKLESLEALKKTFQEIGSQCKNTGFLGFKQSNCGGINSSSKASTNAANRCTSETEVKLWSFWLLKYFFFFLMLYYCSLTELLLI
ncbi:uncharacterized protein LOC110265170 isoform X1 [Arachis ipaensis]|uniref:uncharacterized protein LOC110265170 isoform X1 n=1 Tax=Arachis ipaensis TaxID=130454 RepID=UPI000A2B8EC8|nr:uncharacterized protein LOC110265170 isoform X1 [Arachis ipaensis]XP_025665423.1 uncharacterized protein LOC112764109 isoform X1 [Arachis hypogaea]